jgi:hypothetical protein
LGDENYMDDVENGAPDQAPEKVIPSKKIPSKKVGSKKTSKKTSSRSKNQGFQIPEKVDIIWTVALVVAAFVVGFFVRSALEPSTTMDTTLSPMMQSSPAELSGGQNPGGAGAPALDESQLNQGMPSGHPNIDDNGSIVTEPSSGSTQSDVPAAGSPEGNSVDVKKDPGK